MLSTNMSKAAEVEAELRSIETANVAAFNARDLHMHSYDESAVAVFTGVGILRGAEIVEFHRQLFDDADLDFKLRLEIEGFTVAEAGDLAVERGTAIIDGTRGGEPLNQRSEYMTVWRRIDSGEWKIIHDFSTVVSG